MRYLSLVYFVNQLLHISGIFLTHHQEIYSITPDDGLQICPKHVDVDWRNKVRINIASMCFLLRGYIKMHGQQNINYFRKVWIIYVPRQTGLFFPSRKCHENIGTCKGLIFSLRILSVSSKIWKTEGSGYSYWQLANMDNSFMNCRRIKFPRKQSEVESRQEFNTSDYVLLFFFARLRPL
jgi:hypothetical protein